MNKVDALKKLQEFKERGCHLLIPTTQHVDSLSDQFEIIIDTVKLSGDPKDRDVYPHESSAYDYKVSAWKNPKTIPDQKVRITKHGLEKLNILAGIMWSPTLCREIRDPNIPGRIAYEAVGGVRKPDGTPYFIPKLYAMDLDVEREKLENQYGKAEDKKWLITRDLLQKKSNIATLCESGAKNRVTREILCLNNFYTVKDLEKEFVMARIVPKLDLKDEYTKRRLIDLQLQALTGIYGVTPPTAPDIRAIEYSAPIDINLVEESAEEEPLPETKPCAEQPSLADPLDAYNKAGSHEQNVMITQLSFAVKYNAADWMTRSNYKNLDEVPANKKLGLYQHLLSLQKSAQPDDVPY